MNRCCTEESTSQYHRIQEENELKAEQNLDNFHSDIEEYQEEINVLVHKIKELGYIYQVHKDDVMYALEYSVGEKLL
jgi:ABC-type Zn2+ transport system substrate-binding protein/surface adhesin